MKLVFSLPLGAHVAPFGSKMKSDVWNLAASIGSAVIGAIASTSATADTNDTNRDINQENNEYNYNLWKEQMAATRELHDQDLAETRLQRQEDYDRFLENREHNEDINSVKSIAQRYREAGINPFLAMQNGSYGSISSQGHSGGVSVPSSSIPNAPYSRPYQVIPNYGISESLSKIGDLITDYSARKSLEDQRWIEILKDTNLDPGTKNKIIRHKLFESDRRTDLQWDMMQEEYLNAVTDNTIASFNANTLQERWDEEKKEFARRAEKHPYEFKKLMREVSNMIVDGRIKVIDEKIAQKQYDSLEIEYNKLKRREDLLSGSNMSFQGFLELIMSIFDSNIIKNLMLLRK